MRCSRLFILAAVLTVSVLASCKASDLTGPKQEEQLIPLPSDFDIAISGGTTPTFSWPGGKAMELVVVDQTPGRATHPIMWIFWHMSSALEISSGFNPPVTFGKLPAGAGCYMMTDPCSTSLALQKGTTYSVSVMMMNGSIGAKYFKP